MYRFPNITYCFDGLPNLGQLTDKPMWSPYDNENVDAPSWIHTLTPFVREEMAMLYRTPNSTVLDQPWTYYSFMYIEAYFRIEHWMLTSHDRPLPWVEQFSRMFADTFRPMNTSMVQLRQKYVVELLRHVGCGYLADKYSVYALFNNAKSHCVFADFSTTLNTDVTNEFEILRITKSSLRHYDPPQSRVKQEGMRTVLVDHFDLMRAFASFNPKMS